MNSVWENKQCQRNGDRRITYHYVSSNIFVEFCVTRKDFSAIQIIEFCFVESKQVFRVLVLHPGGVTIDPLE